MAAVAGGTTSLLAETLFPESLRGTTLYKVFIGDAQRFLITQIAQVHREQGTPPAADVGNAAQVAQPADAEERQQVASVLQSTGETPVPQEQTAVSPAPAMTVDVPNYVPRKILGSALETAGLFAMHVSPLWVFAIAGDAAAGTSVFLQRLADQLKKNGVIPADTQVTGLADLLGVVHETSRKSVAAIDTPPLSREELAQLANDMIGQSRQLFDKATDLLPRMETIWATMQQVSDRQNISLDALSGILSIDVAGWARKGVGAVMAVGQTGGNLIGENILDSYAATLEQVSSKGVTQYLSQHLSPFFAKARSHFDPDQRSWTESFLGLGDADAGS
jgi:hypothetical protein